MGVILTTLNEFLNTLWDLFFAWHKCNVPGCDCQHYSDEAMFMGLRSRAHMPSYAEEVIESGAIGKPLKCDVCSCDRGKHGTLSRRVLTPEMIPNGGNVFTLLRKNADEKRRRERSEHLNRHSQQVEREAGVRHERQRKMEVIIKDSEDHCDDEDGNSQLTTGRRVRVGDKIRFSYKMFKCQQQKVKITPSCSSPDTFPFNKFKLGDADESETTIVTVGARNVVEGLDRGLVGASLNKRRHIAVPASMAYGKDDMVFIVEVDVFLSS